MNNEHLNDIIKQVVLGMDIKYIPSGRRWGKTQNLRSLYMPKKIGLTFIASSVKNHYNISLNHFDKIDVYEISDYQYAIRGEFQSWMDEGFIQC